MVRNVQGGLAAIEGEARPAGTPRGEGGA